ncbi:MAG: tetratricopeptide repeat protein, partial [Patescibacteria group bacterium]
THSAVGAILGIFGLLVYNQFNFSTTVHYVIFFLLAAIVWGAAAEKSAAGWRHEAAVPGVKSRTWIFITAVTLIFLNIFFVNIGPLVANRLFFASNMKKTIKSLEQATRLDPFHDEYALSLTRTYLDTDELGKSARALSKAKTRTSSGDYHLLRGELLVKYGFANDDAVALESGINSLDRAVSLLPNLPATHLAYGDTLSFIGLHDEAGEKYEKFLSLLPPYFRWTPEDLATKTEYERTRYRQFFKDNPGMTEILENIKITTASGD